MYRLILLLVLTGLFSPIAAQEQAPPKREFRGVWIATHKRIDFPSAAGLSPEVLKAEYLNYLDLFQKNGLNAVFVQIRGEADAWYDSDLAPWSLYLTGELGKPTSPYFDLLDFMIEATHSRNMEFHAWINPFRAWTNAQAPGHPMHVLNRQPGWCVRYGSAWYLNPGLPEVRAHVTDVVMEVVKKYDVDGIHFDDYFYPYPVAGEQFRDSLTFRQHGAGFSNLAAWRRSNVDRFIREVNLAIKQEKPWVKFGVSPFGVWRNQQDDPRGSATRAGIRSFDDIYADVRTWHQNGWVDYLIPQLYWSIGFAAADYEVLLEWWKENAFARSLYIGHGLYKVANNSDPNWNKPDEIQRQVLMTRKSGVIGGSAFFSAKWLITNPLGFADSLRNGPYRLPAMPSPMPWLDAEPPVSPVGLVAASTKKGMLLSWEGHPTAYRYAVYRFAPNEIQDLTQAANWIGMVGANERYFTDKSAQRFRKYTYVVTALDRLYNESGASAPVKKRQWQAIPQN